MKKKLLIYIWIFFVSIFIFSCKVQPVPEDSDNLPEKTEDTSSGDNKNENTTDDTPVDNDPIEDISNESNDFERNDPEENEPNFPKPDEKTVDSFFWGKWICMADGKEIDIFEKTVNYEGISKSVISSSSTKLSIETFGTFEKQSDSVILNNSIPYFRKGGTNLSYSLKLVGFNDSPARAASGSSLGGYTAVGTSDTYTSFTSSTTSEDDGTINLTAPVSGDSQTISLENGNTTIVVPGIVVSNSDDYLGTIPIVSEGDYILKVSGSIENSEKLDGYLYANNFKTYPMTLTITNVSEVNSAYSLCKISAAHQNLKFYSTTGENLTEGIAISTLKPGATKTININVSYGELTEGYVNTGLNVEITNGKTKQVWIDFVPLRFYRGQLPITVKAKSTEANENASLNGFIIYPDGNNQFFQVAENSSETIYVPTFLIGQNYLLSFSGATVDGELSNSTEMFYSVKTGSTDSKEIISVGKEAFEAFSYGEPNEKETDAFNADKEFQAYIGDGEIDYFKIPTSLENVISPTGTQLYTIKFVTSLGSVPSTLTKSKDDIVYQSELPVLSENGYTFDGWYLNGSLIDSLKITKSVILVAKWTPVAYPIEYNLNGGVNDEENPSYYTIQDRIILKAPVQSFYTFEGWYTSEDFSGDIVTEINKGSTGRIVLYAKWIINPDVTGYTVKHWQQNIENDDYSFYESENKVGITDTKTAAEKKEYFGFTSKSFEQVNIDGDDNAIVNIYYDRKIISLAINLDGGSSTTTLSSGLLKGKYGASVNFVDPKKEGSRFIGWNEIDGKLPQKFESDLEFKALWSKTKIAISIESLSDINVTTNASDQIIKFTADTDFDSYIWTVDDIKQSETSNIFDLKTNDLAKGTYEIFLLAKKGNLYRSATIMVRIE